MSGDLCGESLQPPTLADPEGVQVAGQEDRGRSSFLGLGLTYGVPVLQQGPVPVPGHTGQRGEER